MGARSLGQLAGAKHGAQQHTAAQQLSGVRNRLFQETLQLQVPAENKPSGTLERGESDSYSVRGNHCWDNPGRVAQSEVGLHSTPESSDAVIAALHLPKKRCGLAILRHSLAMNNNKGQGCLACFIRCQTRPSPTSEINARQAKGKSTYTHTHARSIYAGYSADHARPSDTASRRHLTHTPPTHLGKAKKKQLLLYCCSLSALHHQQHASIWRPLLHITLYLSWAITPSPSKQRRSSVGIEMHIFSPKNHTRYTFSPFRPFFRFVFKLN